MGGFAWSANPARRTYGRIDKAIEFYNCDILFIHRDAEDAPRAARFSEIRMAMGQTNLPFVAVIPVRMQEAWLLCDEQAIRIASDNPNGRVRLEMPNVTDIERIADPKEVVFELLRVASEKSGRKLRQFNVESARSRICEQIRDFSVLRILPSFQAFEEELASVVAVHYFDRHI